MREIKTERPRPDDAKEVRISKSVFLQSGERGIIEFSALGLTDY